MKSILITKQPTSNTTLPVLLKLVQYGSSEKANIIRSEIGSGNYSFSVDCRHKHSFSIINNNFETYSENARSTGSDGEAKSFKYINNIFSQFNNPTIQRKYIVDNFLIFEIPDYGSQSMSKWYGDFIVHCFVNGYKLPGQDIGIIKHYSSKTAFVLLPKERYSNVTSLDIRIIFKTNVEDRFNKLDLINSDIALLNNKALNAEYTSGNTTYQLNLNDNLYLNLNLNNNFGENPSVSLDKQTEVSYYDKKYTSDYYRQTFSLDYITDYQTKKHIDRESKETLTSHSYLKDSPNETSHISSIYSRQLSYEYKYYLSKNHEITIDSDYFYAPEDFSIYAYPKNVYDNNATYEKYGKLLIPGIDYTISELDKTKYYNRITKILVNSKFDNYVFEIIPEFYHDRKIILPFWLKLGKNSLSGDDLRNILFTKKIYRWNISSECEAYIYKNGILQFNKNPFVDTTNANITDSLFVVFYDRYKEDTLLDSYTTGEDVDLIEEPNIYNSNLNVNSLFNKYTILMDPKINTYSGNNDYNKNYYFLFNNDDLGYSDIRGENEVVYNINSQNNELNINFNDISEDERYLTDLKTSLTETGTIEALSDNLKNLYNDFDSKINNLKSILLKYVDNSNLNLETMNSNIFLNDNCMFIYIRSFSKINDIEIFQNNECILSEYKTIFREKTGYYDYIIFPEWNISNGEIFINISNNLTSNKTIQYYVVI